MSDPTDLPELEELEPLTEEPKAAAGAAKPGAAAANAAQGVAVGPDGAPIAAPVMVAGPGLPPPGWNPAAGTQYYRFMVAGFIMFLGCMMPFGYGQPSAMHSIDGFIYLFLAIGITWNWWGAIHGNRFAGKHLIWTLMALVPLVGNLMHCLGAFNTFGATMVAGTPETLGEFFTVVGETFSGDKEVAIAAQESYRAGMEVLGVGRVVMLFGAVLMMLFLVQGVMGGAKTAKAQKQARREAASSRRKS